MSSSSSKDITLSITDSQYDAITFPLDKDVILKIIAGPGAGKTRTLVSKIAYSLSQGVRPQDILALSLTNRAVFALRDQLKELVGEEIASQVNIQTFHSYLISVVSSHYSNDWKLLEDVGWKSFISFMRSTRAGEIKKTKNLSRLEMEKVIDLSSNNKSSEEISKLLRNRLTAADIETISQWVHYSKIVTYKGLLQTATSLLRSNPEIMANIQTVIVDEFQDMYDNLLQMIKVLAQDKNLVIAGDPNQSIFGFLGSDPKIMYTFDEGFQGKKVTEILLSECFRSTPEIIGLADAIVQAVVPRVHMKESGPPPILKNFNNDAEEYAFIASEVRRIIGTSNGLIKPSDILILARTNKKIDNVRDYLEEEGIDSVKLASIQSWIDSLIYHFIDYLQILHDPSHADHSITSVLALVDNVGSTTLRNIIKEYMKINSSLPQMDRVSVWEYLQSDIQMQPRNAKLIQHFVSILREKKELYGQISEDPEHLMKLLLELSTELGLKKQIMKKVLSPTDTLKYQEYFKGFYESLCHSAATKPLEVPLIEHFLKHYNDIPILQRTELVNLSTIHSAKGLEFPIVFVMGKEDLYPGQWEDPESEKRNLYVAVTRASSLLYFHNIQSNFRPGLPLMAKNDLTKHFTTQNPSFNSDFWSKYTKSLTLRQPQKRLYHTSSPASAWLRKFSHLQSKNQKFMRALIIKK